MKLVSFKIKNFRGYRETTEIKIDDLTVFVGKNDVGKSTVLEALDIFFNEGKGVVKIEKDDVNVEERNNGNEETVLSACFTELPETVIIDATAETSLCDEYMLNADGQLEIIKKYKNGGAEKTFIFAQHPTNPKCERLLLKKNNELKQILQDERIECDNQAINTKLRKAIWNKFSEDLQLENIEIDTTKEDAKIIWDKLSKYMPLYTLFQSDRKNSDDDAEVQDPLKAAVKQILAEEQMQAMLSEIANKVHDRLEAVSSNTLEKLKEIDPVIADSLDPIIPPTDSLKWYDVFKNVSISGDNNIPINKRGSGVKRLVLLSFFRAEAEKRKNETETGIIYAIEEPETSQHSENQRILMQAFKTLASTKHTQVILTTHSSHIVKQLEFENVRLIKNNTGNHIEVVLVSPGQLCYPSLNEVNYIAFNEAAEEYHNELFGFIEAHNLKNKYSSDKPKRLYKMTKENGAISESNITLTEYIRHQIHHPENPLNDRFSLDELTESIELMREFIGAARLNGEIREPYE